MQEKLGAARAAPQVKVVAFVSMQRRVAELQVATSELVRATYTLLTEQCSRLSSVEFSCSVAHSAPLMIISLFRGNYGPDLFSFRGVTMEQTDDRQTTDQQRQP